MASRQIDGEQVDSFIEQLIGEDLSRWARTIQKMIPFTGSRVQLERMEVQQPAKVKLTLDLEMPLVGEAPSVEQPSDVQPSADDSQAQQFEVTHLQFNLDVSKVISLERHELHVQVVLPDKTVSLPADTLNQPSFPYDLHTELSATYLKWGIYPALQLLDNFPSITQLDIDTVGTVPQNPSIKKALTVSNSAVLMSIIQKNLASITKITIQMGHTFDTYVGDFENKYKLEAVSQFDEQVWPDVYDLTHIRDQLRGGKGNDVYPNDWSREQDAAEKALTAKQKNTVAGKSNKKKKMIGY